MRGWLLLFAAAVLTLVPAAQAVSPSDAIRLQPPAGWEGAVGDDAGSQVCVDVTSLWDDPASIVVIAAQCNLTATVSVRNEDGHLIVTIAFTVVVLGQTVAQCYVSVLGPDGQRDVQTSKVYLDVDVIGDPTPACMN